MAEHKLIYLMLLPVAVSYLVFSYLPMYGIILSVKEYRPSAGIWGSAWADPLFVNFQSVFDTPYFMRAIKNTLVISFLKILFCFPAPIVLALLLNEVRLSGYRKGIQTVIYLPNFISWVIFGSIVYDIFGYEGVVNNLRVMLGLSHKAFMSDAGWYYPILILFSVLKDAGWGTIIYLAALMNVDPQLYEAADLDGAGRLKKMWYITLPGLLPAISINMILSLSNIMYAGFDQIYNTYNTVLSDYGKTLELYLFELGVTGGNYPLSTAVGLFNSLVGCILVLIANKCTKLVGGEGIW